VESHKDDHGVQYKMCKERLRELGLPSFKKKRLMEESVAVLSYLKAEPGSYGGAPQQDGRKQDMETRKIPGRY